MTFKKELTVIFTCIFVALLIYSIGFYMGEGREKDIPVRKSGGSNVSIKIDSSKGNNISVTTGRDTTIIIHE